MTYEEMAEKLKTRGLVTYPFAQQVPMKAGKAITTTTLTHTPRRSPPPPLHTPPLHTPPLHTPPLHTPPLPSPN